MNINKKESVVIELPKKKRIWKEFKCACGATLSTVHKLRHEKSQAHKTKVKSTILDTSKTSIKDIFAE